MLSDKPKNGIRRDFGVYIKGEHTTDDVLALDKGLRAMLDKFMENKRTIKFLLWRLNNYKEKAKKYEDMEIRFTKGDSIITYQKLEYYKNIECLYFRQNREQALMAM